MSQTIAANKHKIAANFTGIMNLISNIYEYLCSASDHLLEECRFAKEAFIISFNITIFLKSLIIHTNAFSFATYLQSEFLL